MSDSDKDQVHLVMGMIPVFIYVKDGVVHKVVADDSDLQMGPGPIKVFKSNQETWETGSEETDPIWQQVTRDALDHTPMWPGWEWGW